MLTEKIISVTEYYYYGDSNIEGANVAPQNEACHYSRGVIVLVLNRAL